MLVSFPRSTSSCTTCCVIFVWRLTRSHFRGKSGPDTVRDTVSRTSGRFDLASYGEHQTPWFGQHRKIRCEPTPSGRLERDVGHKVCSCWGRHKPLAFCAWRIGRRRLTSYIHRKVPKCCSLGSPFFRAYCVTASCMELTPQ